MICCKNKTAVLAEIECILVRAIQRTGPTSDQLVNGPCCTQIGQPVRQPSSDICTIAFYSSLLLLTDLAN